MDWLSDGAVILVNIHYPGHKSPRLSGRESTVGNDDDHVPDLSQPCGRPIQTNFCRAIRPRWTLDYVRFKSGTIIDVNYLYFFIGQDPRSLEQFGVKRN